MALNNVIDRGKTGQLWLQSVPWRSKWIIALIIMTVTIVLFWIRAFTFDLGASAFQQVDGTPAAESNDTQLEVLRAQLDQMQRYDERLLQTVYFALAGVITLGVAVIGFVIFFTSRLTAQDKAAIQTELRADIGTALTEMRQSNSIEQATAQQALEQLRLENRSEISESMRQYVDRLNDEVGRLDNRASATARELVEVTGALEARLGQTIDERRQAIEQRINGFMKSQSHSLTMLQLAQWDTESDLYELQGSWRMVLRTQTNIINKAIDEDIEFYVGYGLVDIDKALEHGATLFTDEHVALMKALDRVGPEHQIMAERIRAQIAARNQQLPGMPQLQSGNG